MSRKHQTPAVAATLLGEMFIVCPGRNQDAHSSQILASTPSPHPGGGHVQPLDSHSEAAPFCRAVFISGTSWSARVVINTHGPGSED